MSVPVAPIVLVGISVLSGSYLAQFEYRRRNPRGDIRLPENVPPKARRQLGEPAPVERASSLLPPGLPSEQSDGVFIREAYFWERVKIHKGILGAMIAALLAVHLFRLGWDIVRIGPHGEHGNGQELLGREMVIEDALMIVYWVRNAARTSSCVQSADSFGRAGPVRSFARRVVQYAVG